jgi:hypothetical protein
MNQTWIGLRSCQSVEIIGTVARYGGQLRPPTRNPLLLIYSTALLTVLSETVLCLLICNLIRPWLPLFRLTCNDRNTRRISPQPSLAGGYILTHPLLTHLLTHLPRFLLIFLLIFPVLVSYVSAIFLTPNLLSSFISRRRLLGVIIM